MNREIKFRAWDRINSRMIHFSNHFVIDDMDSEGLIFFPEVTKDYNFKAGSKERYELMQFTGLKDKNGKEIYEGDILHIRAHYDGDVRVREINAPVIFGSDNICAFIGEPYYFCGLHDAVANYGAEIIGNIYENPELLEEIK